MAKFKEYKKYKCFCTQDLLTFSLQRMYIAQTYALLGFKGFNMSSIRKMFSFCFHRCTDDSHSYPFVYNILEFSYIYNNITEAIYAEFKF